MYFLNLKINCILYVVEQKLYSKFLFVLDILILLGCYREFNNSWVYWGGGVDLLEKEFSNLTFPVRLTCSRKGGAFKIKVYMFYI